MRRTRQIRRGVLAVFLGIFSFTASCVTQTERVPHRRDAVRDGDIWDELRREFGWQTAMHSYRGTQEPFYKRATREIKKTVTNWFHQDEPQPLNTQENKLEEARREFEQKRREAFRRLRAQQALERRE